MTDGGELRRRFDMCTERMRRVWASDAPSPAEPEYEFTFTFVAEEQVGMLVRQFIAASPTRLRTMRYRRVGRAEGGDGPWPGGSPT